MGQRFGMIRQLIEDEKYVVRQHASERLVRIIHELCRVSLHDGRMAGR